MRRRAVLKIELEGVETRHGRALTVDVSSTLLEAGLVPVARGGQWSGQYYTGAVPGHAP